MNSTAAKHHMGAVRSIHMIGVGGVGMSGIAELLWKLDYTVSGSDLRESSYVESLRKLGVSVHIGHDPQWVEGSDVVVYSSAITPDNPELKRAVELRIPVIPRAEMLANLMRFYKGVAVAGTHGKTTTTSMLSVIFAEAGLDPTYAIGGLLQTASSAVNLGQGEYFIAEADESDASFLYLNPVLAVITNVDSDHLEQYDNDPEQLKKTFVEFAHNLPFYGVLVLCADDVGADSLRKHIRRPVRTYGMQESSDYRIVDLVHEDMRSSFKVVRAGAETLEIEMNVPGGHNVLNAVAAIAVACEVGIDDAHIRAALKGFGGVKRRFQVLKSRLEDRGVLHLDDYGHHPTELAAVFAAARQVWAGRRLVVVFQPHRYSRTSVLFERFVEVLCTVDVLLLLDVYAAGESPIAGMGSGKLLSKVQEVGALEHAAISSKEHLSKDLDKVLQAGDILLTVGAGDIEAISHRIAVDGV